MSGLTAEQRRLRDGKLTASVIAPLMTGDADKLLDLWRMMVGDPAYQEPDLSRAWAPQLGIASEAVNLRFYEYRTGRALTRRGEVVVHPRHEWAAATLDAFDDGLVGPVDAKHVGGFEPRATVVARYMPQMTWQMDVTGTQRSALSIIEGARAPAVEIIERDPAYSAELWRRAEAFMACVESLSPPARGDAARLADRRGLDRLVAVAPVAAPVAAVKEYDLHGNNLWCVEADAWLTHRAAAKRFQSAEKELRTLVPEDGKRAYGAGIEIIRNKAGALSIKEMKA